MNPFEMVIHLVSELLASVLGASIVWKVLVFSTGSYVLFRVTCFLLFVPYDLIVEHGGNGRLTETLVNFEWLDWKRAQFFLPLLPVLPLVAILYATVTVIAGLLNL